MDHRGAALGPAAGSASDRLAVVRSRDGGARREARLLDYATAIDQIEQGVCYFDGNLRLVLCNRRYAEMSGLSPAAISPGMSLGEIAELCFAKGAYPGTGGREYIAWCGASGHGAEAHVWTVQLRDGRTIRIHHQPVPHGGFVATHEDISDHIRTEGRLRRTRASLREAHERVRSEAKIAYLERHDPVTRLPNRAAITQERGSFRVFQPETDRRLRERLGLQQELHSVLRHGELVLHYQPLARIDGTVQGFEALLRWQHPKRGPLLPSEFVGLAEESGLISEIGAWVLREACCEAASWRHPLGVAVNISPLQLGDPDLTDLVRSVLDETGLTPGRLELEITEGLLIKDPARVLSVLRRLKALGVRIVMDDFGTGYASLSSLQSFPFDKIKIDRELIAGLGRNEPAAAIVRAVIGLGRNLAMPVIAEGVETEEQRSILAQEGCEEIQGYLIGRPRAIGHYVDLIGGSADGA
jgi:EAL domain-containing protein (putative c-di-GMP-specific phosphodiesterase class I)